jgi:hypothetical protein
LIDQLKSNIFFYNTFQFLLSSFKMLHLNVTYTCVFVIFSKYEYYWKGEWPVCYRYIVLFQFKYYNCFVFKIYMTNVLLRCRWKNCVFVIIDETMWISKVWRCQTKRPLIEEGQTMKWQKEKGQSKTLHRTLKVEHHDPHWQPWVNCYHDEINFNNN